MIQLSGAPNKIIPSNIEAEQAVLGSILIDPDSIVNVLPILKRDGFYLEKHAWIFDALVALHEHREPIDFLTTMSMLEHRNKIDDIGGAAYVVALMSAVPTAMNVETYAREVADLAGKRRLISFAGHVAEQSCNGNDFDTCYADAQAQLLKLAPRAKGGSTSIDDLVAERILTYRLRDDDPHAVAGLPTGYANIDLALSGLSPGLHVWQGETHNGKTTLALNVARESAKNHGVKSCILTLEMSPAQITDRLIAMEVGLNSTILTTGLMNGERLPSAWIEKRERAALAVADLGINIEYVGGVTAPELRAKISRYVAEYGTQVFYIDYGQKIQGAGRESRTLELDAATALLQRTGIELGVPVVLTSQVSRDGHAASHIPAMSRARDSGGLEQNADVFGSVVFEDRHHPFEQDYTPDHVVTVCWQKDRIFGQAVNLISGFKIDASTAKLTAMGDIELAAVLKARERR